jgi:HEAT repeat protein
MADVDDIRPKLLVDEPDYTALAEELGPDAVPALRELVREEDPTYSPVAAYLAAVIGGFHSGDVVEEAARSSNEVIRAAAAGAAGILPADQSRAALERLLADPLPSVRARAIRSAVKVDDPRLRQTVTRLGAEDPDTDLRELANDLTR